LIERSRSRKRTLFEVQRFQDDLKVIADTYELPLAMVRHWDARSVSQSSVQISIYRIIVRDVRGQSEKDGGRFARDKNAQTASE